MFIGRRQEVAKIQTFLKRKTSGILVCSGRRRIGKSTLIEHVGEKHTFLEFYGLAPREGITDQDQLTHFGELLGLAFGIPPMRFDHWNIALATLAELVKGLKVKNRLIIFLDEISWMANKDKDFVGKLKGVWDTKLKKNSNLVLVLCGSVSSWIQENILNDKGFMGRVSLTLHLQEMPLKDANKFWNNQASISAYEKFKVLGVTGGVPRYLEEIQPSQTAEQNLKRLCFSSGGTLVEEFDKIFNDIFGKQAFDYKKIVQALKGGSSEMRVLCERLGTAPSGNISHKLLVLEQCEFIARDFVWTGGKKHEKLSKYRVKDNYLRFYLKYIDPKRNLIDKGLYADLHLENLPEWDTIMGLQFENLVLNNLPTLQKLLDISPSSLQSASPYFQRKTLRKPGCQIDLLIQTRHTIYICEIKFVKKIRRSIIEEVKAKMAALQFPKAMSVRPVLIYQGDLSPAVQDEHFFSHLIPFEQFLMG